MIDTNVADGQSTVSCWDAKNKLHSQATKSLRQKFLMVSWRWFSAISHTILVVFFRTSADVDCNSSHIWARWSAFQEQCQWFEFACHWGSFMVSFSDLFQWRTLTSNSCLQTSVVFKQNVDDFHPSFMLISATFPCNLADIWSGCLLRSWALMVSSLVSRGYIDETMKTDTFLIKDLSRLNNHGRTNRYDANRWVFTIWIRKNKNTIGTHFLKATRADVGLDPSHVGSGCPVVVGWLDVGPPKAGDVLRFTSLKLRLRLCQILRKIFQRFLPQSSSWFCEKWASNLPRMVTFPISCHFPTMIYRRKNSFVRWHWSFDSWSLFSPKKHSRSDVLQERRRKAYNVEYYKAGGKRFIVTICNMSPKKYRLLRQVSLGGKGVFPYIHRAMTRLGFTMSDENPSSFESVMNLLIYGACSLTRATRTVCCGTISEVGLGLSVPPKEQKHTFPGEQTVNLNGG